MICPRDAKGYDFEGIRMSDQTTSDERGGMSGGMSGGIASLMTPSIVKQIGVNATRGRPLTPEERGSTIATLQSIRDDAKTTRRTRIMAARVLVQLEALDQKDLHHIENINTDSNRMKLQMARAEAGLPNDSMTINVNIHPMGSRPRVTEDARN